MVKFILIATLPLLAACQLKQSTEPRSDPPTQAQAEKIIAATAKSYESSDIGEIMARYAEGAIVFDQGLLAPVSDRQLLTKLTQGFIASQPGKFRSANSAIQVLDADTIVDSGVASFTIQLGPSRQLVRARYSQVYQRQPDGSWKIVHEHMSVPPAGSPPP